MLQTAAALAANWLVPTVLTGVATGGALLVVTASQLSRISPRHAIPWVLIQHALLLAIYLDAWPVPIALVAGVAFTVFSFAVLSMERMSQRERDLRLKLVDTIAQLTVARQRLESQARDAERVRISRDLHDLLGHHLVALSLQLQVAERSDTAHARVAIERASSLTRLLLADLRAVVADLRDPMRIDLEFSLRSLEEREGTPRVEVRIDADALPRDHRIAETLLRAAQELVTNARKHANAAHITVIVTPGQLRVQDDGVGGTIHDGMGIRGLRERLAPLQGTLGFETSSKGTSVVVGFPHGVDSREAP